jgi:hypothetical protein
LISAEHNKIEMGNSSLMKSLRELHPRRIDIPLIILLSVILLFLGLSLPLLKVQQIIFWKSEYSVFAGVLELTRHGDYMLAAMLIENLAIHDLDGEQCVSKIKL